MTSITVPSGVLRRVPGWGIASASAMQSPAIVVASRLIGSVVCSARLTLRIGTQPATSAVPSDSRRTS